METALVTGGAGGIGSAVVRALASEGIPVAVNYNSSEAGAKALVPELLRLNVPCICVKADVSDPDQVRRMFAEVREGIGEVGVLVNCAGIAEQELFDRISDAQWRRMTDTILSGTFYCCREAVKHMIAAKRGRIVNISSMWGETGASCEVHYSAAKAGVIGLTKALAKELAPSGITVNCVSPGAIDTKMLSPFSAQELDDLRGEIPMGRLGRPEDVASAVRFLVSDDASYITGQDIAVNGGMVI